MTLKTGSGSSIRDNFSRGTVGDFLSGKIQPNSVLSIVSAYFTIYAYEALADQLDQIDELKFLFGEPRFIATLDPEKTDKKSFKIEDEGLELANRLHQKEIARRCAEWIRDKVEIRSIRQANLLHGKLYHIHDGLRANRRSNIHLYPDDWKNLPIPNVSADQQQPIVALVEQILTAKRANSDADITALEAELDHAVAQLYGTTP